MPPKILRPPTGGAPMGFVGQSRPPPMSVKLPSSNQSQMKPPLRQPVLVQASAAAPSTMPTFQQPPQQQVSVPSLGGAISYTPPKPVAPPPVSTPPSSSSTFSSQQLNIINQMIGENLRVQFQASHQKMEQLIKDTVSDAIKNLKVQYESTQIMGETLNGKTPVFARPDGKSSQEYVIEKANTKLKLFHPMISNTQGYWMATPFVTTNGSVVTGYVPIFTKKMEGVEYGLDEANLKKRREEWGAHLDQLSDKEFVPHVGRFVE